MIESIRSALDCAEFTRKDLITAVSKADPVQAILIMRLIRQAAELRNDLADLLNALGEK